jgi:hypothetical protein
MAILLGWGRRLYHKLANPYRPERHYMRGGRTQRAQSGV